MSLDLRTRDTAAQELMDDDACDEQALRRTYARFAVVNRLLSGWQRTYRTWLRPLLSAHRTTTLLDVGFGGGDLPRALRGWALADGLRLEVEAVDPDPRAVAFVADQPPDAGGPLPPSGQRDAGRGGGALRRRHLQPPAAPPRPG